MSGMGSTPRFLSSSAGTYLSYAITRIPRAPAVLATRRPTLPTPMMPSVLPFISSRPCERLLPQSAIRVRRSTTTACLANANMSMTACSATELEFEPGAWTTAMPRSVAALRSMVSRPTPCRPTTLSCLQPAIRERVHAGLVRKRMPSASCATLSIPASVSSLDTSTRASLSSSLMPSAWMGPARTTKGFMALLFSVWKVGGDLLGGDEHDAGRFQRERPAVEPAEELDLGPPFRAEHAQELVDGVQADFHLPEEPTIFLEPPALLDAARPRVEAVLDADGGLGQPHHLLGRHAVDGEVAVARVEDEGPAGLEGGAEAVEQEAVLVVGEEADAGEEIEGEVELARELHVAHVLADELERQPRPRRALLGPLELGLRQVHAGDVEAPAREGEGVAAEAARRVQDPSARAGSHVAEDPADLRLGVQLGLEASRDGRPRLLEEPAVEHGRIIPNPLRYGLPSARERARAKT